MSSVKQWLKCASPIQSLGSSDHLGLGKQIMPGLFPWLLCGSKWLSSVPFSSRSLSAPEGRGWDTLHEIPLNIPQIFKSGTRVLR